MRFLEVPICLKNERSSVNFEEKTVLLTGGTVRIGQVIARTLAQRKVRIAVHYHTSRGSAQALQNELSSVTDIQIFQADFEKLWEIEHLVRAVVDQLGPIDALINSAAIFEEKSIFEVQEKDWDRHIHINLKAPFFLSQKVATSMLKRKFGSIINIIDYTPVRPSIGYLAYSVSKSGLKLLTKALARELAPLIHVNAIALGPTLPPQHYSEEKRKQVAENTLLKRWGSAGDVARAVLFILEGTDDMTGSILHLDGSKVLA